MNYFKCIKCGNTFVYNGDHIPWKCGAFVGYKKAKVKWSTYEQNVAAGCGGEIKKITQQQAEQEVEKMRGKNV